MELIGMRHNLNLKIFAEDTERQQKLGSLKLDGCAEAQGGYIGLLSPDSETNLSPQNHKL